MGKHFAPQFRAKAFNCVRCDVYAQQEFNNLPLSHGANYRSPIWRSNCFACKESTFWLADPIEQNGRILIPNVVGTPQPHEHMPEDVKADYDEAASIFALSPRGAAALLRLAVQKLMVSLGKSGDKINDDIKALVADGLPAIVQQSLDYCRVVGNNAVHPGELVIEDTPDMAWTMFEMLNLIVQFRIAAPLEFQARYDQLPEGARAAIAKRDAKPPAPTLPDAP